MHRRASGDVMVWNIHDRVGCQQQGFKRSHQESWRQDEGTKTAHAYMNYIKMCLIFLSTISYFAKGQGYTGINVFLVVYRRNIVPTMAFIEVSMFTLALVFWSVYVYAGKSIVCMVNSSPPPPPLDKMAPISQTFSGAFLWMECYVFWLKFNWSLFQRVQ